jgi:hypothetical protein
MDSKSPTLEDVILCGRNINTHHPKRSNVFLFPSVMAQSSPRVSLSGIVRPYLLKMFSKYIGRYLQNSPDDAALLNPTYKFLIPNKIEK